MLARNCCRMLVALFVMAVAGAAVSTASSASAAEDEAPAGTPIAPAEEAADVLSSAVDGDSAHADAHHDRYDLSHGDASAMIDNPIEMRYDMAVATFLVFLVLVALLTRFAWGPIMDGLDRREAAIARRIAEADATAEAAAEQLRQYQEQLAAASDEAQLVITQARKNAESIADKIRDEARHDAQIERKRALEDIQAAKSQALREVAHASADMAVGLAGRILRRELRPDDHAVLIRDALDRFPGRN